MTLTLAEMGTPMAEKCDRIGVATAKLWITLWTTQCCPRRFRYGGRAEAGTVSRRIEYGPTQNLVRRAAESGSVWALKPSGDNALRELYTVYL